MMIPGGNLLSLAMGVIGPSGPIMRLAFTGMAENAAGYQVASYADPVEIGGRVQPIPQRLYQQMGLNLGKDYVNLFTPAGVVVVDRDNAGDRFTWGGKVYYCQSETDWKGQDGWTQITAVQVP